MDAELATSLVDPDSSAVLARLELDVRPDADVPEDAPAEADADAVPDPPLSLDP